MLSWIRENPQLAGLTFGAIVMTLVVGLFAVTMSRSGLSLRPLVWFVGFVALIAGPQAVVHLLDGLTRRSPTAPTEPPTPHSSFSSTAVAPTASLDAVPWPSIFGETVDPTLAVDPRPSLAAILGDAVEARLAFSPDGLTSALAARFESPIAATDALRRYGQFFHGGGTPRGALGAWTGQRHNGPADWAHGIIAGAELYVWTGPSRSAVLAQRERVFGASSTEAVALNATTDHAASPRPFSDQLRRKPLFLVSFLALNLGAATFWFFKGSAWSARIEASPTTIAVSEPELRRHLLRLNGTAGTPATVTLQPDGSLIVDWRYADAQWLDMMRLHRLTRVHRLVLTLDEGRRTVRVREYWSQFDASAQATTLQLAWQRRSGIQFFDFQRQRVFGAQLTPAGTPTGALSSAYTFDLQALKRPLIEAVTGAGWRWQPLAWSAPPALRWLTE